MPSFDVVSKVNLMELDNALNVAMKEISTRYDFRGTHSSIERTPDGIVVRASDQPHLEAAISVLRERMAKRNVSQRCLDPQTVEQASGQSVRQVVKVKMGIDIDAAKKMVKTIKDAKLKVQASIQGDEVRVTAKSKDDLQGTIAFLRGQDFGLDLQFVNFRE